MTHETPHQAESDDLKDELDQLYREIEHTEKKIKRLQRAAAELESIRSMRAKADRHFTEADIEKLVRLNQRLEEIMGYLCATSSRLCREMDARVADLEDPVDDYEICADISFWLGEGDPDFDEDRDNILTERTYLLKRDKSHYLGGDWRESCRKFPGNLNEVPHSWIFHELYDHSYGPGKEALSLHDCLRIDWIWVRIMVEHQSTWKIEG